MKIFLTKEELADALKVYLQGEDVGMKIGATEENPSGEMLLVNPATLDLDEENGLSFELVDTSKI